VFDELFQFFKHVSVNFISQTALRVGATAPDLSLRESTGDIWNLYQQLEKGPVVLVFFRGTWCPYCAMVLQALQEALPQFKQNGGTLAAITAMNAEHSSAAVDNYKLEYPVLVDTDFLVTSAFGLVFKLSPQMIKFHSAVDLTAIQGYNDRLTTPATFVIAQDRTVRFAYVNTDIRQRASIEGIVDALKSLMAPPKLRLSAGTGAAAVDMKEAIAASSVLPASGSVATVGAGLVDSQLPAVAALSGSSSDSASHSSMQTSST